MFVLWMVLIHPIYKFIQSRNWPQVECVIETYQAREAGLSQTKVGNHIRYKVDIQYSYLFDGKNYVSTQISLDDGLLYSTQPPSKISKSRTCYVNPTHPSEALLNRNYNFYLLLLSALPALALCLCIYGSFRCIKILRKGPVHNRHERRCCTLLAWASRTFH